nr:tetratricopeptide repeat protein [Pseudomonas akapageensis]
MPAQCVFKRASEPSLSGVEGLNIVSPEQQLEDNQALALHYSHLRQAAVDENVEALIDLAWIWLNGRGVPADHQLAWRLNKLAAAQGRGEALFNLGEQCACGKGVKTDLCEAADYYEQAYNKGIHRAATALGGIHEQFSNLNMAYIWYLRGATSGDLQAACGVGRVSLNDAMRHHDVASGLYWLQHAALMGHKEATRLLITFLESPHNFPDMDGRLHRFWCEHLLRLEGRLF